MENNKNLEDLSKTIDQIQNIFDNNSEINSVENIDINSVINELGIDFSEIEKSFDEYQPTMPLRYSSSNDNSINPVYAYPTDSGFDLHSTEDVTIESFGRALVPTGLHFDIPDGYEIQVRSKSGLALKQGLMVLNSPGTVDQGYTGEIKVILFNTTNEKINIPKQQKIAQAVVCPVVSGKWITLVKVDDIDDKDRSDNGFGSTGI
jgi:dUTP pyrophosphatase